MLLDWRIDLLPVKRPADYHLSHKTMENQRICTLSQHDQTRELGHGMKEETLGRLFFFASHALRTR